MSDVSDGGPDPHASVFIVCDDSHSRERSGKGADEAERGHGGLGAGRRKGLLQAACLEARDDGLVLCIKEQRLSRHASPMGKAEMRTATEEARRGA